MCAVHIYTVPPNLISLEVKNMQFIYNLIYTKYLKEKKSSSEKGDSFVTLIWKMASLEAMTKDPNCLFFFNIQESYTGKLGGTASDPTWFDSSIRAGPTR